MDNPSPEEPDKEQWKFTPVEDRDDDSIEDDVLSPSEDDFSGDVSAEDDNSITTKPKYAWSALDTFSRKKTPKWYTVLTAITVVVSAIFFLITRDKITTGVFLVCGAVIGVYASKPPKEVAYEIDKYGFKVGDHVYKFGNFKSFSVVSHGQSHSVILIPLRRFMPSTYINFTKDIEGQIMKTLADVLPFETDRNDPIDNFLRYIGF